MKKITKSVLVLAIAMLSLIIFTTKSNAMTANELKDYICNDKGINGTKLVIRDADKVKVEKFFANNEMTDDQANQIKAIIDKGVALSSKAKKQELLSYAQEAAAVMGLTVTYDATEERLDIYKNGALYDSLNWGVTESSKGSTESALVQTGSSNYGYIIIAGIVLIAGIMLVISRKKKVSARA